MSFFRKLFISRKKTSDGRKIIKNRILMIAISLSAGILIGYGFVLIFWPISQGQNKNKEVSFLQRMIGKSIPLQGRTESGDFLFSSFETEKELQAWKSHGAMIAVSDQFPANGQKTLQIVFDPTSDLYTLLLTDLLRSREGGSDWSGYRSLAFGVYMPSKGKMGLTVKITDLWGRQYIKTLDVMGERGQILELMLTDIEKLVDPKKIDSVLFHFKPGGEIAEVFLDNVRLLAKPNQHNEDLLGSVSAQLAAAEMNSPHKEGAFDYGFEARRRAWAFKLPNEAAELIRIPFIVKNESSSVCRLCPVEGGLPLPLGEVGDLRQLHVRDVQGNEIPFQARVLAQWPDQSIKWVGLALEASPPVGQETGFFLDYGKSYDRPAFDRALKIEKDDQFFTVSTGALWVRLNRKKFYLFDQVRLDDNHNGQFEENETLSDKADVWLTFQGAEYTGHNTEGDYSLNVEEEGPLRTVLRSEGWLTSSDGKRFCKVIIRYTFYAGKSHVKIAHTLIYTGYPANLYNDAYKGKVLPENEMIDSFGLEIPLSRSLTPNGAVSAGRLDLTPVNVTAPDSTTIFSQLKWNEAKLHSGGVDSVSPASWLGWINYTDSGYGIGIKVRKSRENFPKAFEFNPADKTLQIDLWPKEAGPLDLQTTQDAYGPGAIARGSAFGLGKTHEMLLYFHYGDTAESIERLEAFEERLIIRANPYWVDATGAAGRLFPVEPRYQRAEKMLENLFDWANRQIESFQWYGMIDFGDTLTWWRNQDDDLKYAEYGWHPVGRWGWYGVEGAGTHTGALLQFMRSGKWKYFQFGENLARHVMDIDTVHYNTAAEDPRLNKVLPGSFSRVGSVHRHNANHWGGRNEESSHTNIQGLILYYYLTGDPRALEVAKESGRFFLGEHFAYIGHIDQAPLRAMANALWGDLLLYEATGESVYKNAADKLLRTLQKGQMQDGAFLDTYDAKQKAWKGEKSELYMAWYAVPTLIKYHELTQSEDAKKMLLGLVDYFGAKRKAVPEVLNGFAYAYLLTHDPKYIDWMNLSLAQLINHQNKDASPLLNGLIYDKPIYHRPNVFLFAAPYAFGALEEHYYYTRNQRGTR